MPRPGSRADAPSGRRTTAAREGDLQQRQHRDIVVVGASAGGVEALVEVVAGLPAEFPASILVVLHVMATGTSVLDTILARSGPLPARNPTDQEMVQRGQIYVAPPDHHMLLKGNRVALSRGPRENGHRPAIDPLFRSAARSAGPVSIGVILSGALDDGTAGGMWRRAVGGDRGGRAPAPRVPRRPLLVAREPGERAGPGTRVRVVERPPRARGALGPA